MLASGTSGTVVVMLASGTSGTVVVMLASGTSGTVVVMLASGTSGTSGTFTPSVTFASSVPLFITFVTNSLASSSVNLPDCTSSLINITLAIIFLASSSVSLPVFTSSFTNLFCSLMPVVEVLEVTVSVLLVTDEFSWVAVEILIIGTLPLGEYWFLKELSSPLHCTLS